MIKYKLLSALLVLAVSAVPALADIQFSIEEPAADSTKSGIGQISGWAVSDGAPIVSIEAFIDGESLGLVPYGGTRQDVEAVFPEIANSEFSGWAMKWSFSLLEPGEHTVTIIVTDEDGMEATRDVEFTTTAFKSAFISDSNDVNTTGAVLTTPKDGLIVITGAEIDGETVDVELKWDKASQQFLISKIVREQSAPQNQPPQADAGPSFSVEPGESITVEGGAYDPDGDVVSYSWSQIAGPGVELVDADSPTVQFVAPDQAGTIRLRLEVMDDSGDHDTDDAVIEVMDPDTEPVNQSPNADAGPGRTLQTNEVIEITGQATDNDGTIVSWYWEQLSGTPLGLQNIESPTVRITAPGSAGEARMRLTVWDDDGATDDDEFDITIEEPASETNNPPTVNAGSDFSMYTRSTVNINGSASDSDGSIVAWQWQRVSGLTVSLQNEETNQLRLTSGSSEGTVLLRLTVTDDDGAWTADEITVTISEPPPPPNQPPTANAGPDKTVNQGENVTVTGSAGDTDGSIEEWSWTQVSGTSVNLNNADEPTVSFTAPGTSGDIRLRLTVTDDDGDDDSDEVTITVGSGSGGGDTTGETLQSMLATINAARGQARSCGSKGNFDAQSPFSWSSSLANIAKIHSMDMATQGYFSHTSKDGTSMGDRVFPYWSGYRVGENIFGSSIDRSNSYVVNAWLESDGHCALIMDPDFTHVGVGAGHNENNGYNLHHFWTLDFGG